MKLAKSVLLIMSIILAFICVEFAVRIFCPQQRISFFEPRQEVFDGDDEWFKKIARPAKGIGFELTPGICGINNLGLFDVNREIKKTENEFRILVMGDSVTTHGNPPYPMRLELLLNKNRHGHDFEVWNIAFPTYNTLLEKKYLMKKGLSFDPDMLILGFCLNDFGKSVMAIKESGDIFLYDVENDIFLDINPVFFSHSHLYRMIVSRIIGYKTKIIRKKITNSDGNKIEGYNMVYESLRDISKIAAEKNIPLLILIFPYLRDFSRYTQLEKDSYYAIIDIIEQLRLPYVNMKPYFENAAMIKKWGMFRYDDRLLDYMHTNNNGHQLIAEVTYNYLLRENLIK